MLSVFVAHGAKTLVAPWISIIVYIVIWFVIYVDESEIIGDTTRDTRVLT